MYCNTLENIEHLLFLGPKNKNIWNSVGDNLNLRIKWKHIVLGFSEQNDISYFRNLTISLVCFCIYKKRVQNDLAKKYEDYKSQVKTEYQKEIYLLQYVKSTSKYYPNVMKIFNNW